MDQALANPKTLRFEARKKALGLTAPSTPHAATVGRWRISEIFEPHPDPGLCDRGIGSYGLVMERAVSLERDAWDALPEACKLANELDVAWCYAWAKPYLAAELQLRETTAPEGWSGNFREVEREIQEELGGLTGTVAILSRNWVWLPCLPLPRVLSVRAASAKAPPIIRDLIELHVGSHKATEGRLFLLAKSLEIVGGHFGTGRKHRNAGIEKEMQRLGLDSQLTQSVEWIFNIMNERFDVRHAWNTGSSALHPRMTPQENTEFVMNADLVIRGFVCGRLGIADMPVVIHGDPPSRGRWSGRQLKFRS